MNPQLTAGHEDEAAEVELWEEPGAVLLVLLDELGSECAGEEELAAADELCDKVGEVGHDVGGGVEVAVDEPVDDADDEREGASGGAELEGAVVLAVEAPEAVLQLGEEGEGPDEGAVGAEEGVLGGQFNRHLEFWEKTWNKF